MHLYCLQATRKWVADPEAVLEVGPGEEARLVGPKAACLVAEAGLGIDLEVETLGQEDQSSLVVAAVRTEGSRGRDQSLLGAVAQTLDQIVEDNEVGSHTVVDNREEGREIRVGHVAVAGLAEAEVLAGPAGTNSGSHMVSARSTTPRSDK